MPHSTSLEIPPAPDLGATLARLRHALAARRSMGRTTTSTVTTLTGSMRAEAGEQGWTIPADLPPALGGEATAPTPSTLLRAALGTCLAMGYRLRAAERAITLTGLRVTVETASDVRGMLDPDAGVAPGFVDLRYHVEIDGDAPPGELEALVEHADRLSPVLDLLSRTAPIPRTVTVGSVV